MRPQLPFLLLLLLFPALLLLSANAVCVPRKATESSFSPAPGANAQRRAHIKRREGHKGHVIVNPPSGGSANSGQGEAFHDVREAVVQLCGRSDYPDICVSSIEPLLSGVTAVDPAVLLGLEIKALRAKVKDAMAHIDELSSKPGTDSHQQSNLQLCRESYEDGLDDINSGEQAVGSRDKGTAESMLSAVITDCETCEDGYAEDDLESPMKGMADEVEKLASNCLAFSSLMNWP